VTKTWCLSKLNDHILYQPFQASLECRHLDSFKLMVPKMKRHWTNARNQSTILNGLKATVNGVFGIKKVKMSQNSCRRLARLFLALFHLSKTRKSKILQFFEKLCSTNKSWRCLDYTDYRCKKSFSTCLGSHHSASMCGAIKALVCRNQRFTRLRLVVSGLRSSSTLAHGRS
jgi:hypothetical protein